jgi:hypothetical protein
MISPLPIALIESIARRDIGWCLPGSTDSLGAREAKVLHQVNRLVAQSKIRRHPVYRFYAHYFDLRQVDVVALVSRIVAASWASASSDHAAATPPKRLMNSLTARSFQ